MTKLVTKSFSGTSVLPIRVLVSLDASLSAYAAWPQLPLAQVVFPCQVPGRCSALSEAGLVTAQGGTVDLPGMGRRALVGWFIIAHTATAILNVFDQYAGSTYNLIC